jgi:regulator of sigma D
MDLSNLPEDLSRLGEALTARIELEDRLIRQLFKPRESVQA